jgi:integrase
MNAETSEAEKVVENRTDRTKTGQIVAGRRSAKAPAKSHVAFWEARVTHREGLGNGLFYVRMFKHNREAWICLGTANKHEAATKALDLWKQLQVRSLDDLRRELKPPPPERVQISTLGEFLTAARRLLVPSTTRPRTFAGYEAGIRRIVSEVAGVQSDNSRFDHKTGGAERWRQTVDAVPLSVLSPAVVTKWRNQFIEAGGTDQVVRRQRTISADSMIRCAKALFSAKHHKRLKEVGVVLPAESPFDGIKLEASESPYQPTVSEDRLYGAAWRELATDRDTLAAFLLLMDCGLRRSEADVLVWEQLDLRTRRLTIENTAHKLLKSKAAARTVGIPEQTRELLRQIRKSSPRSKFVLVGDAPRQTTRSNTYRALAWPKLIKWLRKRGMKARAPLHELRKAYGSRMVKSYGLFAASKHLGHRDTKTTAAHYAHTDAETVSFGSTKTEASR